MSWESAGFLTAAVILALWQFGVIQRFWRRFVLRPITTKSWKPTPQRPAMTQDLRQYIFHRDDNACRVPKGLLGRPCGNGPHNGHVLEPHHWLPWKHFPGLFYSTTHLVTACRKCNRELGAKVPRFARNWNDPDAPRLGMSGRFKGRVEQPDPKIIKRAA